ncbi:uncharacterized protein LOC113851107 [Abrus precatorius]|uniref:Uncharacterized protein LOC113851107 n=1 Tax=Abrus precatorius TaxID=3816 RepID=A0A8B8K2Z2_ABRPR|nr:uncharacterized protein LOC113851107 [Abrus precatorius]
MDEMTFSNHPELQLAWHGGVVLQNNLFYSLKTMKLVNCEVQPYAVPSNILPYLYSLKELEVRDCDNVKVIFNMKDTDMGTTFQLQKLTLQGLSMLTHVWEENFKGILSFSNLQHVIVKRCNNLRTLFPAALAKNLKKLEKVEIASCSGLIEIVEFVEDVVVDVPEKFEFPCLTWLDLNDLPLLSYFYPKAFMLECPELNNLSVLDCGKLAVFRSLQNTHFEGHGDGSRTSEIRQPLFLNLKVISNLKKLCLDWKDTSALVSRLRSGQLKENLKYLNEIHLFLDVDEDENPIFPFEILEKASDLQEMRIGYCRSQELFLTQIPKFGEDKMLGCLKILTLNQVSVLQSIGSNDSPWLNATCEKLHDLNVSMCPDLTTLIHITSAVSFSHLKNLNIAKCHELQYLFTSLVTKKLMHLEQIIVKECDSMKEIVAKENQEETTSEVIKFERLDWIYLNSLSSLECFYSGNDTLQLPSLSQVNIQKCPNMEIFSKGSILVKSFRGIQASDNSNDELVFLDDLNTSVKRVFLQQKFFEGVNEMCFSNYPALQEAWRGEVGLQNNLLYSLRTVKLVNCEVQPYAIPSNILPFFKCLKELEVRDCSKVKGIFEMKDTEHMRRESKLQKLTLQGLPVLTHVWEKNCQGIIGFQNLKHVFVSGCKNLQTLFPVSLAKNLKKLEILEIESCGGLLEIVGKVEEIAADITDKFEFPCMTWLDLYNLPQLTYFSHQAFTLECPSLNILAVLYCPKLDLFPSAHPECEGDSTSTSTNRQPLFSELKAISNLERLTLDWKHTSVLRQLTEDLKYLNEVRFLFDVSKNEKPIFPFEIVEKGPNLQEMSIDCCRSLEIFVTPIPKIGECKMLGQLKILTLCKICDLQSIGSVDSPWLNIICNDTLELPSLIQVQILQCPKMYNFSQGPINGKSFKGIQALEDLNNDLVFHNDLNSSVKRVFLLQKFSEGIDEMCFSNHPELQQAWLGAVGPQNNWFYNLNTMKLVNCDVQPYAIPSNIFPYLKSLKELEVQDCNKVKVIFDMKSTKIILKASKLQKLTLQGLPVLTHVWEKNCQGILSFQNLQHVFVSGCKNLQTLFPVSMAENLMKLEKLEITFCDELQTIVENEAVVAPVTEKFVFPHLKWLDLFYLPQLIYFYSQKFTLECPALSSLSVLECAKLEVFQSQQEAHSKGESEGSIASINKQPLFSDLKVISNLEKLSLKWKDTSVLWSRLRLGQLTKDLTSLNAIHLFFDVDESDKPTLPIEILEKAPNLQEMSIEYCSSHEIFLTQDPKIGEHGMLGHLKIFSLNNVSKLQYIGSKDSNWLNAICEKLLKLNVFSCPDLTTLTHSTSAVSFSYLKELYILECHGLQYLFTSSVAKKLMHIELITVKECDSMKELVAEEQEEITSKGIKFEQLDRIVLSSLSSLQCFYSGNDTLELPSLIQVDIWECPKMEIFSRGSIEANSFQRIRASSDSNDDLVFHNDLNFSVKRKFLEGMDEMCFCNHLELQQAWLGEVGSLNNLFYGLKTMKLVNCEVQPYAIPFNILPYLKSLKELEVRDCSKVMVIFDMKDTESEIMDEASELQKLTLQGLPALTHVWEKNGLGILSFQNLEDVFVSGCKNLQTLFPVSLAKNLMKLEKLEIESCGGLQEIVGKVEDAAVDITEKFVFPCLTTLDLFNLPQLTYFFSEAFALECPVLSNLSVLECDKLGVFQSQKNAPPKGESKGITSLNIQALFSDLKVVTNLEKLLLELKDILVLCSRLRFGQLEEDFKCLNKIRLFFDVYKSEKPTLPIEILEKAPNLQEMSIEYCNSLEIFLTQDPKIGEDGMLGHLKILTLNNVWKLQSIGTEDSPWLNAICEKIHELNVTKCPDMTTLIDAASAVSFSYLKELYIVKCHGLQYLFTSSVAKKLMHLELITVKECDSMKELVAEEQEEITSKGIKFERLNRIVLSSLSSLICFYSGIDPLELPSLIQVDVRECPNMKIFSQGLIEAKSFQRIQALSNSNNDLLSMKI